MAEYYRDIDNIASMLNNINLNLSVYTVFIY